jgi:6-phosphogluconolactonase
LLAWSRALSTRAFPACLNVLAFAFPAAKGSSFLGRRTVRPAGSSRQQFSHGPRGLIDHVPIPAAQVHPIPTNCGSPEEAAALYEATLRDLYGSKTLDPERRLFDVILLGLGEDGHTASLFPGTKALDERDAWVTSIIGVKPEPRISLTYPALQSSNVILFVVAGEKNGKFSRVSSPMT